MKSVERENFSEQRQKLARELWKPELESGKITEELYKELVYESIPPIAGGGHPDQITGSLERVSSVRVRNKAKRLGEELDRAVLIRDDVDKARLTDELTKLKNRHPELDEFYTLKLREASGVVKGGEWDREVGGEPVKTGESSRLGKKREEASKTVETGGPEGVSPEDPGAAHDKAELEIPVTTKFKLPGKPRRSPDRPLENKEIKESIERLNYGIPTDEDLLSLAKLGFDFIGTPFEVQYIDALKRLETKGKDKSSTKRLEKKDHSRIYKNATEETEAAIRAVELRATERKAWEKALGVKKIEVKAFPHQKVNLLDLEKALEFLGMKLFYIPKLKLPSEDLFLFPSDLDFFKKQYPNWHIFDNFGWGLSVTRKFEKTGLKNQWIAIETIPKPTQGTPYEKGIFRSGHYIDYVTERFNLPQGAFPGVCLAVKKQLEGIIFAPGSFNVRLPTAIEWNLLANRGVLDATTNTGEWVEPQYKDSGIYKRLIIGMGDKGGAAYVSWGENGEEYSRVGFRLLIEFKFKNVFGVKRI